MKGISHKQAVKLIHLRLDGLLKERQSLSLNTHLDTCDSCRDYAAEMNALPARLQNEFQSRWDQNAGPSHKVFKHVTTRARKIPMTNRISSSLRLMASAFLVAFLILGINFVILQMKSNPIRTIGTQSVSGSELIDSNLIAFVSDQGGNAEIYTMHADGTNMTNLTNLSAHDVNPVWSPDGKLIAFESDRTGFIQIYTMNPDGSNLTQLTNEEADHSIGTKYGDTPEPWSPDGKKIIFSQTVRGDENNMLYVMNIDGSNKIALTKEPGLYTFLGWSPDGQKIVYQTPNFGHNSESRIMIANVDGTGTIEGIVGKDFGISSQIQWEATDQLVLLAANSTMEPPNWQLSRMFVTTDTTVYNRFGPTIVDSNVPIVALFENTYVTEDQDALRWFAFSGSPIPTSPWYFPTVCEKPVSDQFMTDTYHIVSPDRRHAFVVIFCGEGAHFYLENADGTQINQLGSPLRGPSQVNEITWSTNGKHMIVTILNNNDNNSTDLLRFDIQEMLNDPSAKPIQLTTDGVWKYGVAWQPVSNHEIVEKNPTPEPTPITESKPTLPIGTGKGNGEWIAFLPFSNEIYSPEDMKMDVHMIHPDGSGLTNLTNSPDHYFWLEWSPNGNDLLFLRSSDTAGSIDILRKIEPLGFEVLVHTGMSRDAPFLYRWSPNSEQIAYVDNLAGNSDIYTIYADGRTDTQPKQLTNDPGQEIDFAWSPDGSQIAYQRTIGDQLSIIVMEADGSNQHEVARGKGEVRLYWSVNGNSIYVSSSENNWLECNECLQDSAIYRIDLNGPSVQQIYYESEHRQAFWHLYDTPQNMLYFMRIDPPHFLEFWGTWFRAYGNSVTEIGKLDPQQSCKTAAGNILNESLSPNSRFSVISNFCGRVFDLYLADREAKTPEKKFIHLLQLPLDTLGQGGNFATIPMTWSPDGRWIAYDNGNAAINLLNVEGTLQEPGTEPLMLWQSENDLSTILEIAWQPVLNREVMEEKPTSDPPEFSLSVYEAEKLAFFDVLEPVYLPADYALEGAAYDPWTEKVAMKYVSQQGNGSILIYQQRGDLIHYPNLRGQITPVAIGGIEAEYIQGAWIYESPNTTEPTWDPRADSYSLSWQKSEFVFSVNFIGGETITPLPLNELVAIGESLK